ncbi:MAG: hypothetical protein RHS_3231 [Robinsoniella sp. RHS]|uniref:MFS transporter n=1 Tax=Robinsoniella sp. RHS TaxID=1504536 RepID=UPI00064970F8|nr:MAG: hypothetical protein RHS_3231 [Robinsoniella sp. RHS]
MDHDDRKKGMFAQVRSFNGNQKKFMVSQIVGSVYNSIVSGVLMTGFLLYTGVPAAGVGVILSIPLLANVLQVPFGKIWDFFRNSKQAINRMVLLARLLILSIVFIPLLVSEGSQRMMGVQVEFRIAAISVILFFAYIFASSSGIRLNYWMVNSIQPDIQGTFFAFRDRIVVGLTTLISFGASTCIDTLQQKSNEYIGFAIIFFIAAAIAVIDYIVIRKIHYEEQLDGQSRISLKQCVRIFHEDKRFLHFLIYMFLLSFSMNMANPYYNAYMLEELHLNYTNIFMLTTLQVGVQIAVSSGWGRIAQHIPWKNILTIVTLVLGIQFLFWPLVTPDSIGLILVIFITSGLIATGLATAQFMLPYHYVRPHNAIRYLSINTALSACGGFLGSLTGSKIISLFKNMDLKIGTVSIGSMQMNMIISGLLILGTVCYARLKMRDES